TRWPRDWSSDVCSSDLAIKLRSWTGEKGIYSKLFDQPTTVSLDNPWLFFNVEQLADDPRLETAMSLLIARATAQRSSGKSGQPRSEERRVGKECRPRRA